MTSRLWASAAVVALFSIVDATSWAVAQDQGTAPAPATPGPTTPGPAMPTPANPPAASPPPASTTEAPPAGQPVAPPAVNADPNTAPASQLPEVQVIQEPPKPAPKPKPVEASAPKTKVKPVQQPAPVQPSTPDVVATGASGTATDLQPLSATSQIKISPIGGSEVPLAKVTGAVGRATQDDIQRTGAATAQDVLQTTVPGVIVTDIQGNGFQTNVQYRGFESSPVNGVPQGLAVYQNGVRINESFGDIVNWDFLPSNAVQDITVLSGNPVFGLNAIGGAISITMKDGFTYQGSEIDFRAGSFGRIQGGFQTGQRSGAVAAFVALEGASDDGWRDNSESQIRRLYADLGFKTDNAEFHVNYTGAKNEVGAVAAAPVELLAKDYARTFTSPQVTDNDVQMVSANGTVTVTNTLKISGVGYYRAFQQNRIDGNILEAEDCGDGTLCIEGEQAAGTGSGVNADGTIPASAAEVFGSIDNTTQDAKGYGFSGQAVEKSKLFGFGNQFLLGASYDHGHVRYGARSTLGEIIPRFVVDPLGIDLTGPDDLSPRSLTTTNDYFGVYFSDTLDLTDQLSITAGGRFNFADLSIRDLTGRDPFLNSDSSFSRFNPLIGATYAFTPGLSIYGSYSEANRAPTPAELACSDPNNPCLIESFLTADPPLKQVVSHTGEIGLRGEETSWTGRERLNWGLGLFHTLNTDDIISVAAQTSGRGYFQNGGDTLRQGVEASISYRADRVFMYANYNYVRATFETPLTLSSPNSPTAAPCPGSDPTDPEVPLCVSVDPGDRLPGVPAHKFKAGFDYWMTPKWKFGADLIASSSQIFQGDEGNDNRRLAGYAKVNLHTSYDVTDKIQIYGLVDNLFDTRYGLFGNFFNVDSATEASLGEIIFKDPRTIVPGAPFAAYGGVRIKF